MIIGGLEKFTLIDYPEHLAAVVFTQGCNFRCHFCYNPMLVVPLHERNDKLQNTAHEAGSENGHSLITEDDLFIFLKSRIGKLDAVVISGGEPTLHNDLPEFIQKIKKLDFKVKLDSNGTNSIMLQRLLDKNLLDYVAMDIKAPVDKYNTVTGAQVDMAEIKKSIEILKQQKIAYEFRTTIVPGLHVMEDIAKMGVMIQGADKWYLQQFRGEGQLVNKDFENQQSFSDQEFLQMLKIAKQYVKLSDTR